MKRRSALIGIVGGFLAVAMMSGGPAQAQVHVDIFTGHSTVGGGAPYSGFVGSFESTGVDFGTAIGFNFHPLFDSNGQFVSLTGGLADFGADITGTLNVLSSGPHTYSLGSDDGALLFIDSNLIIDRGGPHGPDFTTDTVNLTAGLHTFEIQFFECCGGPSGVEFQLDTGTAIVAPAPEPATLALLAVGGLVLAGRRWRRRSQIG